jgi:hypothetical protein
VIRRIRPSSTSSALVALALGVTLVSGCSTFTGNDVAAKVGSTELSVHDFQTVVRELGSSNEIGEVDGTSARSLLTEWVRSTALSDELRAKGTPVDQATRDATTAQLQQSTGDKWPTFSPATTEFLIDVVSAQNALVPDDQVRAIYEQGPAASNVICVRFIAVQDQPTADQIADRLAAGEAFESLADEFGDPSAAPNGGVFVNPETGSPCSAADSLNPAVGEALAGVAIGQPTPAVDLSQGFAFFVQRPFDEVAAEASALIEPPLVQAASQELLTDTSAEIDSRYGMWDPATVAVVPSR